MICSNRFRNMGVGTEATYPQRQQKVIDSLYEKISVFAEVIQTGQIYEREDITAAMDTLYTQKADCVLAVYLSWSDDFHWIRFLRDMYPIPILFGLLNPTVTYRDTFYEGDFVQYLCNSGAVGALEASGSVQRLKRPMVKYVVGTMNQVVEELTHFSKAACLRSEMRKSTVGLLEYYNEVMWSTYVDPYLFFTASGAELHFISVATLEDYCNRVSQERVDAYIQYLKERYMVYSDVDMEHFQASVRASLAVEDIAVDQKLCAVSFNDVDKTLYEHIGLRPGFFPSPDGPHVTVTPEGDLGGCLATHILRSLSGQHTLMLEFAYVDDRDQTLVLLHGGPNDYTDPDGETRIARDVRFAKTPYQHAGAPFAWHCMAPGIKTIVHMSQDGETFKMVVTTAEAVKDELTFCSYTHGRVRVKGDPSQFLKRLLEIGVTQHYAVASGDHRKVLHDYADIMCYHYYEV